MKVDRVVVEAAHQLLAQLKSEAVTGKTAADAVKEKYRQEMENLTRLKFTKGREIKSLESDFLERQEQLRVLYDKIDQLNIFIDEAVVDAD